MVKLGLKVSLIETSSQLGRWTPEDWEGPFGIFESTRMNDLQRARLNEEAHFERIPEGFTLRVKSRVMDIFGPQASQSMDQVNISKDIQEYIGKYDDLNARERERRVRHYKESPYQDSWFMQLSHQLASPIYQENYKSLETGRPLPLFSPHSLRHVSRKSYEQSLAWLESLGVQIFRTTKIVDISSQANFIQGLEVSGENSQVLAAEQYIWCLSSEETCFISKAAQEELFPSGKLEPSWFWSRLRIECAGDIVSDLPNHFFLIEDPDLPWTHANLMSIIRTPLNGQFDVWMRLPVVHRFQRQYLSDRAEEARLILASKLPGVTVRVVNLPQESHYDPAELGPVRWPIYDYRHHQSHKVKSWINLHFDSPETWQNLDWNSQFAAQTKIGDIVANWKKERDERRAKLLRESEAR